MKDIKKIVFERTPITQIIDIYEGSNFFEVTGRAGGDVLTFRVYDNGTVCER